MISLSVTDLAGVIYSSGKVFDGLTTGRLDTENFLRSGDPSHAASRQDLALLQDLKAVAEFIIEHADEAVTAALLIRINRQMTRSASLNPGELRKADQRIGVGTIYGRHEPPAVSEEELNGIIAVALQQSTVEEQAVALFLLVATPQPFMDGNKRTALFAANGLLLKGRTQTILTVPNADEDITVAQNFNGLLARAYIFSELEPVTEMLLELGLTKLNVPLAPSSEELADIETFKELIARRLAKKKQKDRDV